jgi:hypothetical protein
MERIRVSLIIGAVLIAIAAFAPSSSNGFAVRKWEAGTCKEAGCSDGGPSSAFYTQAAGHPNFGITDFAFAYKEVPLNAKEPEGKVRDVRVDLPPGMAVNPEAVAQCSEAQLQESKCPAASEVGEDEATGTATLGAKLTVTEKFHVYNMQRKPGQPARFGVEIKVPLLGIDDQSYLEGGISWYHETETSENSGVPSGDFHEYFKIEELPTTPEIVESKLIFWGVPHEHNAAAPDDTFLTLPSTCAGRQRTYLHVDSYENPGDFLAYSNETPVGATGCDSLEYKPTLALAPETTQSDAPDGGEAVVHVPQSTTTPAHTNSPDLQSARATLPEGMTIDPAAAHGLESCSYAQVGLGSEDPVSCPAGSRIGSLAVNAPGIPAGALSGSIYLAPQESSEPESGREFHIFLVAEAPQYGVGVRLEGQVQANAQTGRLTAIVDDGPQVPFEDFTLRFNGGPRAPLANPLSCGTAQLEWALFPYSGQPPALGSTPFSTDANGHGEPCPTPLPFALAQSTQSSSASAGAYTAYTFNLTRAPGQQYLSTVNTALPPGLLGAIPSVALCGEAQAASGSCPASSQIGSATAAVGAGPEPYAFSGPVFLTGPYNGQPYGLSIPIAAAAGPFDLGTVITRAAIGVNPYSGRVTVSSALPTIVSGVPLRLQTLSVTVKRSNFLFNPSNCTPLATETNLTSTFGATQSGLSSPFQVSGCGGLAFTPSLKAASSSATSKAIGASLNVSLTQPAHQANIRAVAVTLPKQLVARLSTLQKACSEAAFAASPPDNCRGAIVGSATVNTPVLPEPLSGSAYLVSHGGAAFPDLDIVLEGDHGVRFILVGNTNISGAITSSTFASVPDVPIASFTLSLPSGPNSALSANGKLCTSGGELPMGTTIVAQSGATVKQNTAIAVAGCTASALCGARAKARAHHAPVKQHRRGHARRSPAHRSAASAARARHASRPSRRSKHGRTRSKRSRGLQCPVRSRLRRSSRSHIHGAHPRRRRTRR